MYWGRVRMCNFERLQPGLRVRCSTARVHVGMLPESTLPWGLLFSGAVHGRAKRRQVRQQRRHVRKLCGLTRRNEVRQSWILRLYFGRPVRPAQLRLRQSLPCCNGQVRYGVHRRGALQRWMLRPDDLYVRCRYDRQCVWTRGVGVCDMWRFDDATLHGERVLRM